MKILWWGNAPWNPSGYGEQAALFLPRIEALGHEVACVANFGLQGTMSQWRGITILPANGTSDHEGMLAWFDKMEPDLVISLLDTWTLKPRMWDYVPLAAWAPVDHYPLPPEVHATLREPNVKPIAMSCFGEAQMRKRKLDPLYIPHGVDTEVFKPRPEAKALMRESMGVPEDAFLIGMVGANRSPAQFPRKSQPQAFLAFAEFLKTHPDAWLYAYTKPVGDLNLDALLLTIADSFGEEILKRVKFPPDNLWYWGFGREQMAEMYSAFDVFLNPSMGEGFGVPIIEAQACGVPVITSNHSSMPEITKAGWLVEGDPWWDEAQHSFGLVPHVSSIVEALERAYEWRDDAELRKQAVEFASTYDVDRVTEKFWVPALKALGKPREVAPLKSVPKMAVPGSKR